MHTIHIATYVKTRITSLGDLWQRASCTNVLLLLNTLFIRHLDEAFFKGDGERDDKIARVVLVNPCLNLGQPSNRR